MESEARKGYVPDPYARLGSAVTLATDAGRDGANEPVRATFTPLRVWLTCHQMVRAPPPRGR